MTPMTPEQRQAAIDSLPKCKYCGGTVNHGSAPRAEQQTEEQIRALLTDATHLVSYGGNVSVDCFIEHHKPFMNYVWYERVGDRLIERPYKGDRDNGAFGFGVWPIVLSGNPSS